MALVPVRSGALGGYQAARDEGAARGHRSGRPDPVNLEVARRNPLDATLREPNVRRLCSRSLKYLETLTFEA